MADAAYMVFVACETMPSIAAHASGLIARLPVRAVKLSALGLSRRIAPRIKCTVTVILGETESDLARRRLPNAARDRQGDGGGKGTAAAGAGVSVAG